jgi:hypothetical protein
MPAARARVRREAMTAGETFHDLGHGMPQLAALRT